MAWKPMALAFLLASPALADVYFGTLSGDDLNSGTVCTYTAWLGGSDPCEAGSWTPLNNTGGCPGQNLDAPNFCGGGLGGVGCPADFQLDPSDDCGATWTAAGDTTPSPPAGTFYANVIDTADKNAIVGRCVYEESDAHYCSDVIDTLLWEAGVHCYMEPGVGC